LFEHFVLTGRDLRNWTPKTERCYRQTYRSLCAAQPDSHAVAPRVTSVVVQSWIVGLRHRGLSAGACNACIRAINSFHVVARRGATHRSARARGTTA